MVPNAASACCRPPAGRRGPSRADAAGAGPGSSRMQGSAYSPPADARARAPTGSSVCRCGARAQWAGAAAGQQFSVWVKVRLWRQGRQARLGPWIAIPHSQPPPPSPSPPSPSPFLTPNHSSPAPFPPAWQGDGRALLLCRRLALPPIRGSARPNQRPCTPAGPAGREYKNTGLPTEL